MILIVLLLISFSAY
ncbi:type I toxin-antitoxin system Ibs family toxin [Klebsiella pneumoniae]|nr:type I toxin-antitoxin system Ibs family toxin [Klebsiella pneumoniae]HCO4613026.1 type I toxin-antitoxin system Ibs family toxin [Escherichia coli]